jgi:hypothetical protein
VTEEKKKDHRGTEDTEVHGGRRERGLRGFDPQGPDDPEVLLDSFLPSVRLCALCVSVVLRS